ncbi:MAG TPA: hypothetical protein VF364_10545 [Candidatus Limnocylindria bacterium]
MAIGVGLLAGCGLPRSSEVATHSATAEEGSAVRCQTIDNPELCPSIAEAFARQITGDVQELVIDDGLSCDSVMLGPACDRPGLTPLGMLTVTRGNGSVEYFNAWLDGEQIVIHDNQPRMNESD